MSLRASLSAAVTALTHDRQVKKWLNRVNEYEHISSPDPLLWHSYTEFNIPWPLKNQDLITKNVLTQEEKTKKIKVEISAIPDYLPRKEGIDRLVHFEGSWNFTPLTGNLIRIDYYIFTKSNPVLPRWITDPIIERGLWNTFYDLKKIISENHANSVSLSYIDN